MNYFDAWQLLNSTLMENCSTILNRIVCIRAISTPAKAYSTSVYFVIRIESNGFVSLWTAYFLQIHSSCMLLKKSQMLIEHEWQFERYNCLTIPMASTGCTSIGIKDLIDGQIRLHQMLDGKKAPGSVFTLTCCSYGENWMAINICGILESYGRQWNSLALCNTCCNWRNNNICKTDYNNVFTSIAHGMYWSK